MAGVATGRAARTPRRLALEPLEARCLMTAAPSDPFAELLSHGGACNCPICSGQGLTAAQPQAATATSATTSLARLATPSGVPQLSSRPGARATLYLDFDGHREASWGSHSNVVSPAYDTDGNYGSYSAGELANIREIWSRVAEDYAPFNINVTTVAPPLVADRLAARIVIGGNYSDWFGSSAGGVAYVGGFYNGASNVGYVFEDALGNGNPRYTAEAATHEAGHLFGLAHQATWSGGRLDSEYNAGSGGWAPIMGVGYYAERTTWHRGPTSAGASALQDDLAILSGPANGFGYAPDDYGSTVAAASALPVSGRNVSVAGLIGRDGDRDVFRFTTGGGSLNLSLGVAQFGANLDGVLELVNSVGQTIASANPAASFGASLARTLAAGTYYLVVRSGGGYGNLGRYTLRGTIAAAATAAPAPTPSPATSSVPTSPTPTTTAATRIIDNGAAGFTTSGAWQHATGVGNSGDISWTAAGAGSAAANWTFSGLASGYYRVAASWPGSRLYSSRAPFSIYAGNQLLATIRVNQERAASTFSAAGTSWQNLGTFAVSAGSLTVRLKSDPEGRVIADAVRLERVYATSGGTLVRSGALLPSEDLADTAASPAADDQSRGQIDDAIFAPADDGRWAAQVQRHLQFARELPVEWSLDSAEEESAAALLDDLAASADALDWDFPCNA